MRSAVLASSALVFISMQPAQAQGGPNPAEVPDQMMSGDVASAAKSAAQILTSSAKETFLVKDLIGAQVKGPSGNLVGTVGDLVVIPGGRVIAAIVSTKSKNTGRIPVPFSVVKLTAGSGKPALTLPVKVSELRSMKEVQQLKKALPSMK